MTNESDGRGGRQRKGDTMTNESDGWGRSGGDYEVGLRTASESLAIPAGAVRQSKRTTAQGGAAPTYRQIQKDILEARDADVAVQRNGKRVMMSFWPVFLETLKADAVDRTNRDFRARKLIIDLLIGTVTANEQAHPTVFAALESVEKHFANYPAQKRDPKEQRLLNEMRRRTRPNRGRRR